MKKVYSTMKSHPAAVDVTARWAEVHKARKDQAELADFLEIRPDKSPAAQGQLASGNAPKGASEQKVAAKDKEVTAGPQQSQKQPKLLHLAQAQAAPKPAKDANQSAPPDGAAAEVAGLEQACLQALPARREPEQGKTSQVAAKKKGKVSAASTDGMTASEREKWKEFTATMGPDWQRRFAKQAVKRLKTEKKEKKEKKAKKDKKDKDKKAKKNKKKDKENKEKKEQKEKKDKETKKRKGALDDDDDEDTKKGKKEKKAAEPMKEEPKAKPKPQTKAKASQPKEKAKAKAKPAPKAQTKKAALQKTPSTRAKPKPKATAGSAAGLAAKFQAKAADLK